MSELAEVLRCNLSHRQGVIDSMLTTWPEVLSCLEKGGMGSGDGMPPQMPEAWRHGAYPVLDMLLKLLRQNARTEPVVVGGITRSLYWHVAEWYLRSRRTRRPAYRVDRKQRRFQVMLAGVPQFELITIRHEDVDAVKVLAGVEWLDKAWSPDLRLQPEAAEDTVKRVEKMRAIRGSFAAA